MTNKEILQTIQALRDCARREAEDCPFTAAAGCDGCDGCQKVSADLIERLTAENAAMREKQAKAEAERNALIEQIKERHDCMDCKHIDFCKFDGAIFFDCMNCVTKNCPCAGCCDSSRWEWRGLPEAPEEGEKA